MMDYNDLNNRLLLGNCLERLQELTDKSVDTTITSPPYNMNLRIRNGKYCSRQIVKEITTKYVDFDDNLSMEEYYNFNVDVISELLRVSKMVFYNIQILTGNKPALFKLMGHFHDKIKEIIIWDKINAQPAIGSGVLNSQFEIILVLSDTDAISRQFKNAPFDRGTLSNCWGIKRGKKISKDHGAIFPEELVTKVVESFTHVGDTILDPFMGTGTTGVVCGNLNRKFIGIELSKNYFKLSKQRITGIV